MVKTQSKLIFGAALLAFLMLTCSAPTYATPIVITLSGSGASCGGSNCFGNVLTLTITPTGGNNYTVQLDINTSGNTNPGTAIAGVDFKFGNITSLALSSFNGGSTAGWATNTSNLSASGCGSNLSPSFGCSEDSAFTAFSVTQSAALSPPTFPTPLAPLPNNGTYTWIWNNVTSTGWNGSPYGVHIGAVFGHIQTGNAVGKPGAKTITYDYQTNGLISASTAVPEPGSLMLFGTGLIGLGGLLRRRMR